MNATYKERKKKCNWANYNKLLFDSNSVSQSAMLKTVILLQVSYQLTRNSFRLGKFGKSMNNTFLTRDYCVWVWNWLFYWTYLLNNINWSFRCRKHKFLNNILFSRRNFQCIIIHLLKILYWYSYQLINGCLSYCISWTSVIVRVLLF